MQFFSASRTYDDLKIFPGISKTFWSTVKFRKPRTFIFRPFSKKINNYFSKKHTYNNVELSLKVNSGDVLKTKYHLSSSNFSCKGKLRKPRHSRYNFFSEGRTVSRLCFFGDTEGTRYNIGSKQQSMLLFGNFSYVHLRYIMF